MTEPVALMLTEAEERAAIGRRADFYLAKWSATEVGGFNWAAFFVALPWLAYRKMYRNAATLAAVACVESVLQELLFVSWLGREVPRAVDRAVAIAVCVVCGRLGNGWYRSHVRRLVLEARTTEPDEAARLALLARRGGTSLLAAIGVTVLFFAVLFVAFAALTLVQGE